MCHEVYICLALLFFLESSSALLQRSPSPKRNVLLLISDDLRAEIDSPGFACTSVQCSTPSLNRLAKSSGGLSFTRAYVQQALCAPTRNSFMTGRRPDTTKAWNFIDHFREPGVGADWKTLPQVFKGYLIP